VEPLRSDFLPKEEIESLYFLMGGVAFVLLIARPRQSGSLPRRHSQVSFLTRCNKLRSRQSLTVRRQLTP
jgi:hypothetical protein